MNPSIVLAIPTGGRGWAPEFCMSLINLLGNPLKPLLGYPEEPPLHVHYHRSSNLPQNRHNLVRDAKGAGATHILWLDDDMVFPADTLGRLLRLRTPIAACNCTTRAYPIIPTAVKANKRVESGSGVGPVDQVGMAVMLTQIAVFDRVPLPWFKFEWDAEYPDTYCSEDMYFCRKARKAGFSILIDHDLSREIGHIGEMEYRHEMVDSGELAEINARAADIQRSEVA